MKLEFFRLILSEDEQLSMFSEPTSRSEAITQIFTSDFDFTTNRGKAFKYIYKASENDYIIGLIFERQNITLLEDPRSSETQKRPNWEPHVVIINNGTTKGENSQLFLVEYDSEYDLERRLNLLNKCLADRLNQILREAKSQFRAEFAPVLTMKNFEELYGREGIKELIIEYTMPNFLGIGDKLNKKLGEIKARSNATRVRESISNENGNLVLDPDYEDLQGALETSRQGQSRIKIKDFGNAIIYDSVNNETVKSALVSIGEIDIQAQDDAAMHDILITTLQELKLD